MAETWCPVVGYKDYYEVSDHGRVRSVARIIERGNGRRQFVRERILTQHRRSPRSAHLSVTLLKDGKYKGFLVHRLVLEAFVGPCPEGMQCCHANDVGDDNRLENLRWDTQSENQLDSVKNGHHGYAAKTHCKYGHEWTPENTRFVRRKDGRSYRVCRACDNPRQLTYYYQHRKRTSGAAGPGKQPPQRGHSDV